MGDIVVLNTANDFRACKVIIMPVIGTFDGSGVLRTHLVNAMKARGAAQLQLRFEEPPLPLAMGILATKFMNMTNIKHLHFGPALQT